MPIREQNSNKGTFGKVLNFCGSKNYIGAAYLSTIASLKVGAGLSALASEKEVISSVSAQMPEAVYLSRKEGVEKLDDYTVVLIGCGLGTVFSSKSLFKDVLTKLQNKNTPIIIDADGLNILAKGEYNAPENTIITPHPMEAARLLNTDINEVLSDLQSSAKKLTEKYNCVTVLKSHRTIICNKNFDIYVNNNGNSALAKSGTGDVLAGIISGLLAQNMSLFEAAKLGVHLHARTGEIASEKLTEYSVLASDLFTYLPQAIKECL